MKNAQKRNNCFQKDIDTDCFWYYTFNQKQSVFFGGSYEKKRRIKETDHRELYQRFLL